MVSIYCTITLKPLHINSLTRYTIRINPPGPEINPNNFNINIHSGVIILKCFNYPFHETHPLVRHRPVIQPSPRDIKTQKIVLVSCTGTISQTPDNLIECCNYPQDDGVVPNTSHRQ